MAGEFIFGAAVSTPGRVYEVERMNKSQRLTIDRMYFPLPGVSLTRKGLAQKLLLPLALLLFMVLAPAQPLVMVEEDGGYYLLGAVLTDDVLVDSSLEVTGVELWHAERGFGEHGPAPFFVGVKTAREARVEVGCSPRRGSKYCG